MSQSDKKNDHMIRAVRSLIRIAAIALLIAPVPSLAQNDLESSERRVRELQEMLSADERKLSQTQQAQQQGEDDLRRIDREIKLREELVVTYRQRQEALLVEQDSLRTSLALVEDDLGQLKQEYRERASHAYKHGRQHDVALILAAESINEMLVRVRYLKRFSQQRQRRLDSITAAAELLEQRKRDLENTYSQTERLLVSAQEEQVELARLRSERTALIRRLRREQSDLQQQISERRSTVEQLQSRIRSLVSSRATPAATGGTASAASDLTGPFENNRGNLPWPSIGVVREPFGQIVNPVHGTTIDNPGILIATSPSAEVKAVFDGSIVSVDIIPEFGTYVVVAHGSYHSVYSNFSLLYVAKGEPVSAGQLIGRSGTDAQPKGEGVFFAIFKDGQPTDPVPWLGRP